MSPHLLAGIATAALITMGSFIVWYGFILASIHQFLFGYGGSSWNASSRARRIFWAGAAVCTIGWAATCTWAWYDAFHAPPPSAPAHFLQP